MTGTPTSASARRPPVIRALSLARALPLLTLAVVLVILVVSLSFTYYEIRQSAEATATDRLLTVARRTASLSGTSPTQRRILLAARDTAIQNVLRAPERGMTPSATAVLEGLRGPRSDSTTPVPELWTAKGQRVGSMALESPDDAAPFRSDLPSITTRRDSVLIGPFYRTGNRAAYWEATPVRDGDRHLLGYIAQQHFVAATPSSVASIEDFAGRDFTFYLRNADSPLWVKLTGEIVSAPSGSNVAVNGLATYVRPGVGLIRSATAQLGNTPAYVTVEIPNSTILERPRQVIRTLAVIGIALAILGALIAWLIARQLIRPLGEVTAAAEALARGDYARRVPDHDGRATNEVGRLGVAFNQMAHEVQASHDASAQALSTLTQSAQTQEFLGGASRLLAGSLSDQTIIAELARYCVPTLADYCSIHVVGDNGDIERIETAHYDPAQQNAVRALVGRYRYRLDGPSEVSNVIRTQMPLLIPRIEAADVLATAPNDETRRLLETIAPTSFLCVPLVARGRAFGAISFTMTHGRRTFTQADLELAMELARRTAVAIDNALIYRASLALRLEAEAASRSKSDFLAKMSHEIRTPINAMMGYAELLQMGIAGPITDTQGKHLTRIRASGEHLTALVNEILDLAKIEAGRMSLEPTVADASEAVDAALALIRPQALAKGVELTVALNGASDLEYVGDRQRVQQILTNLLSNAVKFTGPGGAITIRCHCGRRPDLPTTDPRGDWASIVVEDTGVGIATEDLERIFQPFVQADGGYTRAHGGTGLGLTISRTLAQMMGGEITVESTVGAGSRFALWLPSPNSCTTAT